MKQKIFVKIPKPSLFGQNFEKAYFDILSRVFVYETLEDIADDLNAYETLKKDLVALKNEGLKVLSLIKRDDKAAGLGREMPSGGGDEGAGGGRGGGGGAARRGVAAARVGRGQPLMRRGLYLTRARCDSQLEAESGVHGAQPAQYLSSS